MIYVHLMPPKYALRGLSCALEEFKDIKSVKGCLEDPPNMAFMQQYKEDDSELTKNE